MKLRNIFNEHQKNRYIQGGCAYVSVKGHWHEIHGTRYKLYLQWWEILM